MKAQKNAMETLGKTESFQDSHGKGLITGTINALDLNINEFERTFKRELEQEQKEIENNEK
jgi:hypothetical protein